MSIKSNRAELSEQNFRRINWINIALTPPLLLVFSWPFFIFSRYIGMPDPLLFAGTFCFAFSFTMTILHGHVTIALGALHRDRYHQWLDSHRWGHGFLIRPLYFSTRFRLIILIFGFVILITGLML